MSVSNKDIALSIIDFLKSAVAQKEISEDYAESMDVAIDCIADAFEVAKDDDAKTVETKFNGVALPELIKNGLGAGVSASASTSTSASAEKSATAKVSPETEAQADQLKVEGNRAMAAKKFDEAIAKYSEAIKLNDTNVIYLSNRAAAYSSSAQHEKAVEDAERAIALNPNFSKAYSRLGLAKYALGDANAAMDAYKNGLDVEGDNKSDAMKRGYETAKRRVEEELESSIPQSDVAHSDEQTARGAGAGAGAGAGGMPDFSSMFGGGGMPNFSEMMNNPQIMQAAQQMMQNPGALEGLMNNPSIRQMAQSMGLGGGAGAGAGAGAAAGAAEGEGAAEGAQGSQGGPDLSELLNNPMLRNLASQFGGNNNNNNNS